MRSLGRWSSFWLALVTSHFLASPSQVASHFLASPSQVASHFFASPSQVTSHKNSDSSPTRVQVAWLESTPLVFMGPTLDPLKKHFCQGPVLPPPLSFRTLTVSNVLEQVQVACSVLAYVVSLTAALCSQWGLRPLNVKYWCVTVRVPQFLYQSTHRHPFITGGVFPEWSHKYLYGKTSNL